MTNNNPANLISNKTAGFFNRTGLILRVTVRDRAGALFEGEAEVVSSHNDKGPFDILPLHTNFISIIHKGVTLYLKDKIVKDLSFETGVLKVAENKVEIYLGILR